MKEYTTPEMEITVFETEDIITTSGMRGYDSAAGEREDGSDFGALFGN